MLTRSDKRTHMPHGVGNMSEQSIIWHLNQGLQIRKTHKLFLCSLKVKRHYKVLKHWLVPVEPWGPPLCCTVTSRGPCFYLPQCRIWKGTSAQSKEFLLWLLLSNCFVRVKAAGERVEAQQCIQTWNTTILTLLKAKKTVYLLGGRQRNSSRWGKKRQTKKKKTVKTYRGLWKKGKNMSKLQN